MFQKFFAVVLLVTALFATGCGSQSTDKPEAKKVADTLVIYTSMKDSLIGSIVEGFKTKYPDIEITWRSSGAGKIMTKLEAEQQSGRIMADIVWTSEISDFYRMKNDGLLEKYTPAGFDEVLNPFDDYDGSFTAARLGTLGIVVNTIKIKTLPESWETVATDPAYKNSFGIADPTLSGTAFMGIALLAQQFGWDYIVRLHDNGALKSKGSGRVIDDTADGILSACLGVDYITAVKIDKGSPLKMVYPKELLMVPSPAAILKSSEHKDNAKKFLDYLMTKEAQQKVANAGTVPVRKDVTLPEKYNLPKPEDALANGIKVNYSEVLANKDETLKKFSDLFD